MIQVFKIMTKYSLVRQKGKMYIITTISTPNHHTQSIATTSLSILNLITPVILPPVGKEDMNFLREFKSDQVARCIKSRIMTKVIDCVLSINTFEQQCVVLKGMLQSPQLKYHMHTIGIDQPLIKNAIYEHKCLENIKKLHKNLVSATTSNNSKILLRLIWFIIPKDSRTTFLYLP